MSRAIIAIVKGGLGNQLFIYAAARAMALRTGRELYLDNKRGYTADAYGRSYRLERFPIQAKVMPEEWRVASHLKHPRHKFIRLLNKLLSRDARTYLAERRDMGAEQLTTLNPRADCVTLMGYWQHEAYFAEYADIIRRELTPPEPMDTANQALIRQIEGAESVFIHVRRVQYPNALSAGYYREAISRMRQCLARPRFVIFGDDLEWAKAELDLGAEEVLYVQHNTGDELADLWLMTRCRHAIIANSSFSWWGAWLGERHASRILLAPDRCALALPLPKGWRPVHFL